jgi:hypothetical protein
LRAITALAAEKGSSRMAVTARQSVLVGTGRAEPRQQAAIEALSGVGHPYPGLVRVADEFGVAFTPERGAL